MFAAERLCFGRAVPPACETKCAINRNSVFLFEPPSRLAAALPHVSCQALPADTLAGFPFSCFLHVQKLKKKKRTRTEAGGVMDKKCFCAQNKVEPPTAVCADDGNILSFCVASGGKTAADEATRYRAGRPLETIRVCAPGPHWHTGRWRVFLPAPSLVLGQ